MNHSGLFYKNVVSYIQNIAHGYISQMKVRPHITNKKVKNKQLLEKWDRDDGTAKRTRRLKQRRKVKSQQKPFIKIAQ